MGENIMMLEQIMPQETPRRCFLNKTLKTGATIQEAQALARHANINTTLIYAHNVDRIKQAPERKVAALISGNIGNTENRNIE